MEKTILLFGIILTIVYTHLVIKQYIEIELWNRKYTKDEINLNEEIKNILIYIISFSIIYVTSIIFEIIDIIEVSAIIYILILNIISIILLKKYKCEKNIDTALANKNYKKLGKNEFEKNASDEIVSRFIIIENLSLVISIYLLLFLIIYLFRNMQLLKQIIKIYFKI